jgi:hypothetical protein
LRGRLGNSQDIDRTWRKNDLPRIVPSGRMGISAKFASRFFDAIRVLQFILRDIKVATRALLIVREIILRKFSVI